MSERNPIVLYHANCMDGFTAAYVFWEEYKDLAEYHPLDYKDAIPVELIEDRQVIFVDICMPEGVMRTVAELSGRPCLVLDHHIGMQDTFRKLEEEHVIYGNFALQFSGAGLAWNWLHPGDTPPWLIAAVEDRDLWKFHIADSKPVLAYIGVYDFDFQTWESFRYVLDSYDGRREFASCGNAILQYQNRLIRNACRHKVIEKRIAGIKVPCLNLDYSMASEAGHELAEKAPFAAIYNDEPAGRRYSLRSRKDGGEDVCKIAKMYGGGGHKNASGFLVPWDKLVEIEYEFRISPKLQTGILGEK